MLKRVISDTLYLCLPLASCYGFPFSIYSSRMIRLDTLYRLTPNLTNSFFFLFPLIPLWEFQMGSTMKKSIFDEQTNKALMSWAKHAAKKKVDGKPGPIATHNPHSPSGSPQDSPSHPHSRKVHGFQTTP